MLTRSAYGDLPSAEVVLVRLANPVLDDILTAARRKGLLRQSATRDKYDQPEAVHE